VEVWSSKTVSPRPTVFKSGLVGRQITKIARRGKLLILSLAPVTPSVQSKRPVSSVPRQALVYPYLLIHLKMTGQLIYVDRTTQVAGGHSLKAPAVMGRLPNQHTRVSLTLAGGGHLFFNDIRKFGYLKLATAEELAKLLKNNYGPEPLTKAFSLPVFAALLKNKTTQIKALLLDQKTIAGLGNIYVDESLYAARLRPQRPAGSFRPAEVKALWLAINKIIKRAVKYRGTTFSNYVDSQGRPGNFSRFLKVYGRAGQLCPRCHKPLVKTKVAGRGTHYCPTCQK
jgi:formamidopyrimidine-DNA glycosylase